MYACLPPAAKGADGSHVLRKPHSQVQCKLLTFACIIADFVCLMQNGLAYCD